VRLERELVLRVAAPDPQHAALTAGVGLFLGERDGPVGVFGEELRLTGADDAAGEHRVRHPVGARLL
jgi:hypothetical protein